MKDIIGNGWWDFETKFEDIIIRNDTDFVRLSFEMPPTHHHYHNCYNPISNAVHDFVNTNISIMISAGNIEGAIMALGGNKTSNIVELVKRKKLEELEEIEAKVRIYTIRNDEVRIKEWSERKDHIKKQIEDIDERFQAMLTENCNICLEPIKSPVLEPNCQNLFCGECLLTWMKNKLSCPMCRVAVNPQELIYISNSCQETVSKPSQQRALTKLEKTIEIIKSQADKKILIFSEYDSTFAPIWNALEDNGIKYAEIRGNVASREKNLERFRLGDISVIFLNSKFDGSGINLQEATDIILYHEMSPNTQKQIIGRANRIGRQKPLQVHHLQVEI